MPFFPSSDGGTEAEKEITSWVKLRQASLMVKCQPLPAADHENPKPITATSRLPGGPKNKQKCANQFCKYLTWCSITQELLEHFYFFLKNGV